MKKIVTVFIITFSSLIAFSQQKSNENIKLKNKNISTTIIGFQSKSDYFKEMFYKARENSTTTKYYAKNKFQKHFDVHLYPTQKFIKVN